MDGYPRGGIIALLAFIFDVGLGFVTLPVANELQALAQGTSTYWIFVPAVYLIVVVLPGVAGAISLVAWADSKLRF